MNRVFYGPITWEKYYRNAIPYFCVEMIDMKPFPPPESGLIYANVHTIILTRCDPVFINQWIIPEIFPNLDEFYIRSKMNNGSLFKQFPHAEINISYPYKRIKTNWANTLDNVFVIKEKDFNLHVDGPNIYS